MFNRTKGSPNVFGKKARDSSVPKFKVLMVSGFLLINVLNLCTLPFRSGDRHVGKASVSGLSNVLTPPSMDPFKVAHNGLDYLYKQALQHKTPVLVTVLPPIKYELHSALLEAEDRDPNDSIFDGEYTDQLLNYVVGGRVVEGVLRSFEDPVVSKWIIADHQRHPQWLFIQRSQMEHQGTTGFQ